jgi:hypothetical protein
MFTLAAHQRFCGGLRRRDFLRVGALGAFGLSLPALLEAAEARPAAGPSFGRAKRCVLLFLHGGPPQHETWDPKPQAPREVRGELGAIPTCVPGIQIGELFPRVAQVVDRLTIVRSVTHHDTVHTSAGYTMLTGAYHARPNQPTAALVAPGPDDFPHPGALVSLLRPSSHGLPPFVALPEVIKDAGVNTFPGQGPGLLGERFGPFLVECDQARRRLEVPDVFAAGDLGPARLLDRRALARAAGLQASPPRANRRGCRSHVVSAAGARHGQLAAGQARFRHRVGTCRSAS